MEAGQPRTGRPETEHAWCDAVCAPGTGAERLLYRPAGGRQNRPDPVAEAVVLEREAPAEEDFLVDWVQRKVEAG